MKMMPTTLTRRLTSSARQGASLAALLALVTGCGQQASETEDMSDTLIVGGATVAASEVITKSTVALVAPTGQAFCTGSLIGKRLVLTASHCVDGYEHESLYVAFGTEAKNGSFARERLRAARAITMHEDYDTVAMDQEEASRPPNDIALVKLAEDAPAAYAPVAMLTTSTPLQVGEMLTLAGFGLTHYARGTSGVLRKVDVKLTKLAAAAKEIHFGETPGKSACMGDSGGPAFVKRAGKLVLVGVTSRGDSRCSNDGIYTDARYFSAWIRANGT